MNIARIADGVTWQDVGAPRTFMRDPALQPFTATSVWNLPIANTATFEAATDTITADMIRTNINAWVNQATFSHPVYQASYDDPIVLATDSSSAARSGAFHCATTAVPSTGSDRHLHVIDPHGRYIHENIGAVRGSTTALSVSRHHAVDLYGDGLGPFNGVRAYGGSAIGGLLRAWETDSTDPRYTGVIAHALAIALDSSQMLYTSGVADYNHATGYGRALGYVWPATEQDGNSTSLYTGNVPMGTYCAIPPSVDITQLGLATTSALMVAKAMQDYGGYITDTTAGTFAFYIETYAPTTFRTQLLSNSQSDLKKIRAQIRAVTNNSSSTPNGGSLTDTRRQPLALDLPDPPGYGA